MKIQFIKGLKQNYTIDRFRDGIYFAEDTNEILVNEVSYGLSTLTKNAIYSAINAKVASVEFTVPGTFKFLNGNGEVINTITLVTATQQQAGFMSAEDKKALDDLINNKFTIKASDSLLALNENMELFSKISLSYEDNKIKLFGQNEKAISEIDASNFIKDGMLNQVELVQDPEGEEAGTYLKLVFNTDAGKQPILVNVTRLVNQYDGSKRVLTGYQALEENATPITETDTVNQAIAKLAKLIEENEQIAAAALVDINNRISKAESATSQTLQQAKDYVDDSLTWILA